MNAVKDKTAATGTVLEIQRMSTEDGPGIRTTVFMKGCPLSCLWCHNPESISSHPQINWTAAGCLGCGACVDICPERALTLTDSGVVVNRGLCAGCGRCAELCPSAAIELLGKRWEAAELAKELAKDRAYFESSGGGVTVSGGESTMQTGFVSELLKELRAMGIQTAIDTCGLFSEQVFTRILPFVNIILYDIKESDPRLHTEFTGVSNEKIIKNLKRTAEYVKDHLYPETMWIRTPLIPGMTARVENILKTGRLISALPGGVVSRWELCAFNNLCADKYKRLGIEWQLAKTPLLETSLMDELVETAKSSGVDPAIVFRSGSTV